MKMRAVAVALGSVLLTSVVIGHAYYQKKQFYPSVVYLTKSNPSMAVIYLQAFVLVVLMGKLMRKVFFGQLRPAEFEHLIERSWYAVTETCLAFTVFRDDFSPKFVALFTVLLFLKSFHWLADDRVDYMERSPVISWVFHVRVLSLLTFLGGLDSHFVGHAYRATVTQGASVQLVFGFEYAILLTIVVNIAIKYVLHVVDMQSENPWENKAVFLLYTELVVGFIKVLLYLAFVVIMMRIYTLPLFAFRPMYLTMRAFRKAFNDVILSRRAIHNMNTLYADATPEEIAAADNVCIICREEMVTASKKLPCNHIFHTSCLRSWFQRQQTCPTCRLNVLRVPTANTAPGAPPAATPPQNAQQQARNPGAARNAQPGAVGPNPFLPAMPGLFPALFPYAVGRGPIPMQQGAAANGAAAAQQPQQTNDTRPPGEQGLPFPLPPFPFMPYTVPPPMPLPDLMRLSDEELRAMEGQQRANIEARIRCLHNIQTLLDSAVMHMQQYSSIVATLDTPGSTQASTSSPGEATDTQSPTAPTTSTPAATSSSSTNTEQDEVRRRRLERFAAGNAE